MRFNVVGWWIVVRGWISYAVWLVWFRRKDVAVVLFVCVAFAIYFLLEDPTPEDVVEDSHRIIRGL